MKLVFLHGAGNSSLSYYYQLRHFRNSKAIDLPGHSTGQACNDIPSYLEWVRGFITARRYKDVVLCGHSMGGANRTPIRNPVSRRTKRFDSDGYWGTAQGPSRLP
ncbi:MAG: hypothetical protein CM1200mP22_30900 [Dehalococcoidia bacterium]|nr:MAG: hypothetical protein CM1200mP22_30900 [Dehalococcoidia bacterium]